MKSTRLARVFRWYDLVAVLALLLALQDLVLGGVKVVYVAQKGGESMGLMLVLRENADEAVASMWRRHGTRLVRSTAFERPLLAFLLMVPLRFALGRRLGLGGGPLPGYLRGRFLLSTWVLVSTLALAELAARRWYSGASTAASEKLLDRVAESGQAPAFRPNAVVDTGEVVYAIDSQGFRGPERPAVTGRTRVFFLGDSFTFGPDVPEDALFLRRVERTLRDQGMAIDVVNGAVWSYDTKDEVALLERRFDEVRPQAVVLVYYLNDAIPGTNLHGIPSRLYRELASFRFVVDRWQASRSIGIAGTLDAYQPGRPEWVECQVAFERFAQVCRERGAQPLVVLFPGLETLNDYRFRPCHQAVVDTLRPLGVECFDLLTAFEGKDEREMWVHSHDHHPSVEAHRIAAEALAPWLAERLKKPVRE